ncbi:hypothetical protein [Haloferula sp. BvORR071]|uniref:hypothetical protein n=1 Tax=Haloferula sp. BvORR071 TaxID=1396141 RepID=UPI00054DDEAF|nr:hypothetical protein [Haloferula sp. BvORR071]
MNPDKWHFAMRRRLYQWACLLLAGIASAQDPSTIPAPDPDGEVLRKDIEIIVDVSGSMDSATACEAIDVVTDLIRGQMRRPSSGRADVHEHWQPYEASDPKMLGYLRVENADKRYNFLKVDYFRRLLTGEGEVKPLAGDFDQINITYFGDRERTLDPSSRFTYRMGDLHRMGELTRTQQFKDGHTNLQLAMAQVRSRKGSQAGYYLFVISDGQDDPEVNEKDATLLGNWGPDRFLKDDHGIVVLAHQPPGQVGKKTKPYICMVAAGFDPVTETQKVVTKEVPKIEGAITLLGGLASETPKVFLNQAPYLAWQIERDPTAQGPGNDYKFRIMLEDRDAPQLMVYALNTPEWQGVSRISLDAKTLFDDAKGRGLRAAELPPGNWIFTVEEQEGRLKPTSGTIVVERKRDSALAIASLAGLTSLLLFAYSWWAVRQRRSKV